MNKIIIAACLFSIATVASATTPVEVQYCGASAKFAESMQTARNHNVELAKNSATMFDAFSELYDKNNPNDGPQGIEVKKRAAKVIGHIYVYNSYHNPKTVAESVNRRCLLKLL
jgi:hypothetical protein